MKNIFKFIVILIVLIMIFMPACKSSDVIDNNGTSIDNGDNQEDDGSQDEDDDGEEDDGGDEFDINGLWTLTLNLNVANFSEQDNKAGSITESIDVEFSGTNTSGDVKIKGVKVGTYNINNLNIEFNYNITNNGIDLEYDYDGTIDGVDEMHGNVSVYQDQQSFSIKARVLIRSGTWKGKKKRTN